MEKLNKKGVSPVIGVILPGARAAARSTRCGRVAVIGTAATIDSGAYVAAIHDIDPGIHVVGLPCPMFVPLVEEGWTDNEVARLTAKEYLHQLHHIDPDIDTLVLGCTHYPLLKPLLQRVAAGIFERKITLVDSALETARTVKEEIQEKHIKIAYDGATEYYVTDFPERFTQVGGIFLGENIDKAERVLLPGP